MRSGWAGNGGLSGLMSGSGADSGTDSDGASQQSSDGSDRSQGKSQSDSATWSRFGGAPTAAGGPLGSAGGIAMAGAQMAATVADKAAAFAESALGTSIGHGAKAKAARQQGGSRGRDPLGSDGGRTTSNSDRSGDAGPGSGTDQPSRAGSEPATRAGPGRKSWGRWHQRQGRGHWSRRSTVGSGHGAWSESPPGASGESGADPGAGMNEGVAA